MVRRYMGAISILLAAVVIVVMFTRPPSFDRVIWGILIAAFNFKIGWDEWRLARKQ